MHITERRDREINRGRQKGRDRKVDRDRQTEIGR